MKNQGLPLISIITPSFNQASFIKQTIDSVLMQDYPNIEHIVVDGGSTDGTLEILHSYRYLGERFRFVSEQDRGQSDAINKGLSMARGEIIGWLNSDDTYLPGAVSKAMHALTLNPAWSMVYGNAYHINEQNKFIGVYPTKPFSRQSLFLFCIICQPSAFVRKEVFQSVGGVDESLHYCMDYDLWLRISTTHQVGHIDDFLAASRLHAACKSIALEVELGLPEILKTSIRHFGTVANDWLYHFLTHYPQKGVHWFLDLFKAHHVFGNTPILVDSNRYSSSWVPPRYRLSLFVDPLTPMQALLIKGVNTLFSQPVHAHVLINNVPVAYHVIPVGHFETCITLPVHEPNSTVELICSRQQLISSPEDKSILQPVSFQVQHVFPLSAQEQQFYMQFIKNPQQVAGWLLKNRHPVPAL
ncbi:glycosyltransferase family 2 protein [uncultured Brevibacillus sp.]|uniref:glycosyltransferase family 2 protein n=1 Tax=uncultured Brevibacillus sp. TaxID=169970 RepID=UPI002594FED3|nr:glycosyltransferase family 2 protein [uncultured Brevibacillus sp.]